MVMRKIGNKGLWVFLVGIFLFLLRTSPVMSGQIIVDSDEQFALGRATMEKGEYGRAVVEFERFIHFFPESPKVLKARYLIGVCYLKGGRGHRVYLELKVSNMPPTKSIPKKNMEVPNIIG